MELHYKCTTWCKLIFPDTTNKEDLIQKLNEGYYPLELGYDDVVEGVKNVEWEAINDTEQFLSVNENDGDPTIELYEKDSTMVAPIWDNSYQSELKRKQNDKSRNSST